MKNILITGAGVLLGFGFAYFIIFYTSLLPFRIQTSSSVLINPISPKKTVIGFLPYWLLDKASYDYSKYITTLTYFGLRIDTDGTILKLTSPTQEEPGWNALSSGKADAFLQNALEKHVKLSLLVSSGDNDSINQLVSNPINHAKNLIDSVSPILIKYRFSDLNLDIEYTQMASPAARTNFSDFVKNVRRYLPSQFTLTVEISGNDVIKPYLIDPKEMGKIADNVVLMAYDFHSPSSFVSGPVAPIGGAGIMSEYDVTSATEKAIAQIPNAKLILGIPLYGYEWETLSPLPRSADIPNSGVVASNRRAEELLSTCTNCEVHTDTDAMEKYITYYDSSTGTYHIIFYPDQSSTISKINLANNLDLGGIALWALGYEGNTILNPLVGFAK